MKLYIIIIISFLSGHRSCVKGEVAVLGSPSVRSLWT